MPIEPVISDVIHIIEEGRKKAYQAINTSMVEAYWLAGKRIVEDELDGHERAEYGKSIIKKLSEALTDKFGKGFSVATLYSFKQFYATFSDENIFYTLCRKLSWSHNRYIMRVVDKKAQLYYLRETYEQNWGVRQLERNINTLYYQRLVSSNNPGPIEEEMLEKTEDFQFDSRDFIRNPTVLEFCRNMVRQAHHDST